MKEKTNNSNTSNDLSVIEQSMVNTYVVQDFRTSILIVSILVNLVVFTTWLTIQVAAAA